MSWAALGAFAAGSYALKAAGLVVIGRRALPSGVDRVLALLPAALFGALVLISTFELDEALVVDPRVVGLLAAAVAVWRRAGFMVVIVAAATTTAAARAVW